MNIEGILGMVVGLLQVAIGLMIGFGIMAMPSPQYIGVSYVILGLIIISNRLQINSLK